MIAQGGAQVRARRKTQGGKRKAENGVRELRLRQRRTACLVVRLSIARPHDELPILAERSGQDGHERRWHDRDRQLRQRPAPQPGPEPERRANVIIQHSYTLDSVDNRTALAETLAQVGGGSTSNYIAYSYDHLYRLTGDGTRGYTYDPVGNRLTLTQGGTTSYSYDRADRILTAGSASYTVNANGNLTARGPDSFAYDQANRLKSATVGGTTTTYAYDGDGKRASQTTGSATTTYAYDVNQSLPVVLTDVTHKYVYGMGLAYSVDSSGNIEVYHTDGLGSVRAVTDGSGNLVETYHADPFGVPTTTQGTSTQPFQFTGQQQDPTGLLYLRARYYDPTTGRFLSRDPLAGAKASPQSLNRYIYVVNNPLHNVDPSGRDDCPGSVEGTWEACGEGGGEVGGGFGGDSDVPSISSLVQSQITV